LSYFINLVKLELMEKKLLILLTLTLTFVGCNFSNLRETMIKRKELHTIQNEPERKKAIEEKDKEKQKAQNDSLVKTLLGRFSMALKTDSIEYSYTYHVQELLEKSSDILFFKEADIKDIERATGYYLITVYSFFPEIVGQFKVNPRLSDRLLRELKRKDDLEMGCLVVKVDEILPVKTDILLNIEEFYKTGDSNLVSEDDIKNNVHIKLNAGTSPFYFIKGELIDFYLLR
jgi:hypothetical protein